MENHIKKRNLKYVYSDEELIAKAHDLADSQNALKELEDSKKSVMSDYTSRINAQKEQISLLTNRVTQGYEPKDVECAVRWHYPEKGYLTLIRPDVEEDNERMEKEIKEKMNEADWDTWNDFYKEEECDCELHIPDIDKKTYVHRETGVSFVENMSYDEKEKFENECEVQYHVPEQGKKTFTHIETGLQVTRKMSEEDFNLWNQEGAEGGPEKISPVAELEGAPEIDDEQQESDDSVYVDQEEETY